MLTSVAAAAVRWQQHQQQQSRQQQQLQQQHQQATELTFAAVAAATAAATAVVAATAAGELARLVGGLAHIIATDRLLFSCICIQYAKVHTGTLPDPTGVAGEFGGGDTTMSAINYSNCAHNKQVQSAAKQPRHMELARQEPAYMVTTQRPHDDNQGLKRLRPPCCFD